MTNDPLHGFEEGTSADECHLFLTMERRLGHKVGVLPVLRVSRRSFRLFTYLMQKLMDASYFREVKAAATPQQL